MKKTTQHPQDKLPGNESSEWLDFFTLGKTLYSKYQKMAHDLEVMQAKCARLKRSNQRLKNQNKNLKDKVEDLGSKLSKVKCVCADLFPVPQKQSITNNFYNQSSYNPNAEKVNYE